MWWYAVSSSHRRLGLRLAGGGARGAAPAAEGGAACSRPAAPGSGCAPACRISTSGPIRSGRRPEPTNGRPLRPGWPNTFPGRQVCPRSLTEGLPDCPQVVSRPPGRGQSTPGFTDRAAPAWLGRGRLPVRSSSDPAAPGVFGEIRLGCVLAWLRGFYPVCLLASRAVRASLFLIVSPLLLIAGAVYAATLILI